MNKCIQCKYPLLVLLLVSIFSISPIVSADTPPEKSKILKSSISEDVSYNGFALSMADCVNPKNKKDSFTLEDKKVTWSAAIRDGLGKYNASDYAVYWYAPDGILFEKQAPKPLFVDCAGLKSSLVIDADKMKSKMGLWKAEVIYKNYMIDSKYFYLTKTGTKEIAQNDIDSLAVKIVRTENIAKTKEEAEKIQAEKLDKEEKVKNKELVDAILGQPIDTEKSKALISFDFKTTGDDIESLKDQSGIYHIAYADKKIYWKGQFQPFFGVTSPKVQIYWLTPDRKLFASNNTSFLPTNDAAFYIKGKDISKSMLGEWLVIVYVNKSKILEQVFVLDTEEGMQSLIVQKMQAEEKANEERRKTMAAKGIPTKEEIGELTKTIKEKYASITSKYVAAMKKKYPEATKTGIKVGDAEGYVIAAHGRPMNMLLRKDGIEIWYYWEQGLWDSSRSMAYSVRGNFVGEFFSEMNSTGTLTKIFIEDGAVIEITKEDNVTRAHIR